jgi:hypothetical protein
VAAANRCVDEVLRRVQSELLGHRGRKDDPLYKIRRVLLTGVEPLNARGVDRMALGLRLGDPDDEVLGTWLAKEYLRDIYLTDDPYEAAVLLDPVIAGCLADEVAALISRRGLTAADGDALVFLSPNGAPLRYTVWRWRT